MSRNLLEKIEPGHWSFGQQRHLQGIDDLINRPVNNRGTAIASGINVNANGAVQSTGIGIPNPLIPKRYAELTVKSRITFNINSTGPVYLYVYRTKGNVPANGAAPNAGDVQVGGDSFWGGPTANGVNHSTSYSVLDTGLLQTQAYKYYLAVLAPNGSTISFINSSQLVVMERS